MGANTVQSMECFASNFTAIPIFQRTLSRARAIFNASEEAKPFDPTDLDFAMLDEEPAMQAPQPSASIRESSPAQPLPRPTPQSKRFLGMTRLQLIVVAGLASAFLCLLAVFAYLFSTSFLLP